MLFSGFSYACNKSNIWTNTTTFEFDLVISILLRRTAFLWDFMGEGGVVEEEVDTRLAVLN